MFGRKNREWERKWEEERQAKRKKLEEYNYNSAITDDSFLGYIEEFESVRDHNYDSKDEEIADLLKLIARQNLLLLAKLDRIDYNIPEGD